MADGINDTEGVSEGDGEGAGEVVGGGEGGSGTISRFCDGLFDGF